MPRISPPTPSSFMQALAHLTVKHDMTLNLWRRVSGDGQRYRVYLLVGFHASAPNVLYTETVPVSVPLADAVERVASAAWGHYTRTGYEPPLDGAGLTPDDLKATAIYRHNHPRPRGIGRVEIMDAWLAASEDHGGSMCGRFRDLRSWSDYRDALASVSMPIVAPDAAPNLQPREQVRPTDKVSVFLCQSDGSKLGAEYRPMRWWYVPWFHRGTLKEWKLTTFNARAETVKTSRTFRDSFTRRRCLIAASGWYEFTGPKGDKTMWLFEPKDRRPIMFAGIWDRCDTTDQGVVESCTIITQPAGSTLNSYHDRAPVVLAIEDWRAWLDLDADVDHLLGPESADLFDVTRYTPPASAPDN